MGVHEHEPSVGSILRGARLGRDVAAHAIRMSNALARPVVGHAAHHVEDGIGNGGWNGLPAFAAEARDDVAPGVFDTCDEPRRAITPVVRQRAVGARYLQQRHLARAQPERGHFAQLALDAHPARILGDRCRTDPLDELRGDRVLGIGQRVGERHHAARGTAHVRRRPTAAGVRVYELDFLVPNERRLRKSRCQGRRVHEGLEGRARLPFRRADVIVLDVPEVTPADPGPNLPTPRIQCDESGLHASKLVLQRIDERGRAAQRVDGGLARNAGPGQGSVSVGLADKGIDGLRIAVPEIRNIDLAVGNILQAPAYLVDRALACLLKVDVDRRVYAQPIRIQVCIVPFGPVIEPLTQIFGEVGRRFIRPGKTLEIEPRGFIPVGLEVRRVEISLPDHLLQDDVAALVRSVGMAHGVVVDGALEHADQRRGRLRVQLRGRNLKIRLGRRLDAEGVIHEGDRVEIHLENPVLLVHRLEPEGGDPFLQFSGDQPVVGDGRKRVSSQLHGDRRAPLPVARNRLEHGARHAHHVDPAVLVEAVILRRNKCLRYPLGDLLESDPSSVLVLIARKLRSVRREDDGRTLEARLFQLARRRQLHQQHNPVDPCPYQDEHGCEQCPRNQSRVLVPKALLYERGPSAQPVENPVVTARAGIM